MLPRLTPDTPENAFNLTLSPGGLAFLHALFLQNSKSGFLSKFVTSFTSTHWKDELANNAGWAFTQAVGAMIQNTYNVSNTVSTLENDDDSSLKIDFQFPRDNGTADDDPDKIAEKEELLKVSSQSDGMFHSKLRKLYESAHQSGKDQLRIRLEMNPTGRCILYNLFCFPFLTRKMVEGDSVLRSLLQGLVVDGVFRADYPVVNSIYQHILPSDDQVPDYVTTTVEMQVLIECDEVFQVIDSKTGAVLQGTPDGSVQRVVHLARFEVDVKTYGFCWLSKNEIGNWQLTDIDDLLGHATWYQGKI
ncbi:hypothetical protein FisN_13Lh143 [Fistulifera solaris]|uniref:Uncharacterized protein n=1 Tax=Fistulifera solaris TaxID=1519565 RepID=A0A1Z5JFJ9_FISSO|nr:hypothetical protein FisN_13Lh143 [Fistulifera solaris]|eukprot:GAX12672.1 hypothetical protein FisN_13Lh143 [Fistulifera solaris]